jgi:hypothetical protein
MIANVSASQIKGMTDELMQKLRKKCIGDVKHTIGNIRTTGYMPSRTAFCGRRKMNMSCGLRK